MQQPAIQQNPFFKPKMSTGVFGRFSDFIYEKCGIKMPPAKKTMLTARLTKRLRILGISSFGDYYDYVTSPNGLEEELVHMINVVTTNKTDFFREPGHFDFLIQKALPVITGKKRLSELNKLNIWSAGCSSGEEPYTLAMVLSEYFENRPGDFSILATDISTKVLAKAKNAVYTKQVVQPVTHNFRQKYLMRGTGSQEGLFRIVPELRKKINFQRLNLLEGRDFGLKQRMDMIFCRNVIIYFDRPTQIGLFEKYYRQLIAGGYLFIGHSETLNNINKDFVLVGSAVYEKPK